MTRCPPERAHLDALAKDHGTLVLQPRRSLLDLLDETPACPLTFGAFLEMLPPMRARLYSIASSPAVDARRAALTVSVLDAPAWSGLGRHHGVASTHLAKLPVGATVRVALRSPNTPFRVPDAAVPMVMIGAGSGIAPFRGFLQDRAAQRAAGVSVAPSLLYFGCDDPAVDLLYRDELARWESDGIVSLRATFCRAPVNDQVFVQHRLVAEADAVRATVAAGATVFLCGDGAKVAPAVRAALATVLGADTLATLEREGRFVADVFS